MVVSFANRVSALRRCVLLLSCGPLCSGCADLIGAEFKDFTSQRDAGALPSDVSSIAEASDHHDGKSDAIAADTSSPDEGGRSRCTPGQVNDIAGCSNCGHYLQICNAEEVWDPPYCQEPPGACASGTTEQRACEDDGTLTATCASNCVWQIGACLHSTCSPAQSEKQPCGLCGTQSRACQAADGGWKWSPFSACMGEKDCAPLEIERETCGKCGTHARACSIQCTWGTWEICQGEGACVPGDTQERGCLIGLLKQTRTCDEGCSWGEWIGLCL
jgi:hypothetical protein